MKEEKSLYTFNFNTFRLTDIHFSLNEEFLNRKEKTTQVEITTQMNVGYEVVDANICRVDLEIQLVKEDAPFKFSVKGQADFSFKEELREEKNLEKIVYVNLLAIIYPFLREPIADVTRRMGFNPLLLSPVNFMEYYKNKESKESTNSKKE